MKFSAPWAKLLWVTTILSVGFEIGLALLITLVFSTKLGAYTYLVAVALIVLAGLPAFFIVRGYEIDGETLWIQRLVWRTKVDLKKFVSVEKKPDIFKSSIRIFGNGGVYSFCGIYKSMTAGLFHAYLTDPKNTVVLKLSDRTIAVSPDRPDEFILRITHF